MILKTCTGNLAAHGENMSTVVIKKTKTGWEIAGDNGSVNEDGSKIEKYTKICKISSMIVAGAGDVESIQLFKEWISDGMQKNHRVENLDKDFIGITIDKTGASMWYNGLTPIPIEDNHTAIGTGGCWAIAALDFGKSVKAAVKYAAEKDVYTSIEYGITHFRKTINLNA